MATRLDEKIFYLKLEYGLTELQINNIVNEIIANNDELLANTKDRDGLIYDLVVARLTETAKEADTNNNKGKGFDVLVVTHPDVIRVHGNEEFATYGRMQMVSHFDGTTQQDWNNYIAKRGYVKSIINLMEDIQKDYQNEKILADRTIKSHTKKLINSDKPMVKSETYNGKSYYKLLNSIDGKYYIRIPYQQMRELVIVSNGSMLRLYALVCSILKAEGCGYDKYHPINRKYLAECLGYSTNSKRCLDEIGTMLTALCKLGHLERIETTEIDKENNTYKTKYSYRRTTLAEWQEANNRGTIKK